MLGVVSVETRRTQDKLRKSRKQKKKSREREREKLNTEFPFHETRTGSKVIVLEWILKTELRKNEGSD